MTTSIVNKWSKSAIMCLMLGAMLSGCSDELPVTSPNSLRGGVVIDISSTISPDNTSRADESGWADGDRFGLYIVNFSGGEAVELSTYGNHADNVALTYDADKGTWQAATDLYWLDDVTPADFYGYYPFSNTVTDVKEFPFEVSSDQSSVPEGEMSAYEASDFLWSKAASSSPGKKVQMTFTHRMSGVKVQLQRGNGYTDVEWAKLPKIVTVDNTVRTCLIDLSTGTANPNGNHDKSIVMRYDDPCYRAVVVPQTVASGNSIIGVTIDGVSKSLVRTNGMSYLPGRLHTFTIVIDKTEATGDFDLKVTDEDIVDWEADNASHDFDANAYIVVNVDEGGTLGQCLAKAGNNASTLKNLKITGKLNPDDFTFIRQEMKSLTSINLKECVIVDVPYTDPVEGLEWWQWPERKMDNKLPDLSFDGTDLHRIILPKTLCRIGVQSLSHIRLTSMLTIPNSVRQIESRAFDSTTGGSIAMPDSLEKIGEGAFLHTMSEFELKLTNTIKEISVGAFEDARGATGVFSIPSGLKKIEDRVFSGCGQDMTGDIVIPVGIEEISEGAFGNMGFRTSPTVTLPEGLKTIGVNAFRGMRFKNVLKIPESVTHIHAHAFRDCSFSGGQVIMPKNLIFLGRDAFGYTNLGGELVFPSTIDLIVGGAGDNAGTFSRTCIERLVIGDNVQQIETCAFLGSHDLRYISIGKNVSFIGREAFNDLPQLQTMVCMAVEPPRASEETFGGVYFDKAILEVPEESVERYRHAEGWKKFQNITAHHELAFNIPDIQCLDKGMERSGVVRSEGAWYVSECPSWVHVTPNSGEYKEDVTITIDPLVPGDQTREGRIVFSLRDKNYSTYTTVMQHAYEYAQDTEIVLQTASAQGNAVPVFIVGEGFGAESIISGEYLNRMRQTMEQLFAIEPYKSYAEHFTVTTAIACSPDNGSGDIYSLKSNCFGTNQVKPDTRLLRDYVSRVSTVAGNNLPNALIIMVSNYSGFLGWSEIDRDGCSIAGISVIDDVYPYDQRGLVQHFAGGRAFAGLGNESVVHFEHIKGCTCPDCADWGTFNDMKSRGYYTNLTASGKMKDTQWADFIFHPKYSAMVDMYEGGYNHLRGIWRSEAQSVMNGYVAYFNAISRYTIYKEIMRRAGLSASFDDFVNHDIIDKSQL